MPYKDRAKRLAYHRQYFSDHRDELHEQAKQHLDATNARRRDRRRLKRDGFLFQDRRTTHGKTHTTEYLLLTGAKKRSKSTGMPCNLTVLDIPAVPDFCPVLGIKIERSIGRMRDSSPSLDRIDPLSGYVRGNVRVISWRANRLRSDGRADELMLVALDAARLENRQPCLNIA